MSNNSVQEVGSAGLLVFLEDEKRFKSFKRHLRIVYDMSPDQYRAKGGYLLTIPWWLSTTLRATPSLLSAWAWVSSAAAQSRSKLSPSMLPRRQKGGGARRPPDPNWVFAKSGRLRDSFSRGSSR